MTTPGWCAMKSFSSGVFSLLLPDSTPENGSRFGIGGCVLVVGLGIVDCGFVG